MSVKSCEKLEKNEVALTVEVGAEEFQAAVEKAYRQKRKDIRVPGFRPGKAPRQLIEKMYGPEVFYSDAIDLVWFDAYVFLLYKLLKWKCIVFNWFEFCCATLWFNITACIAHWLI